MAKNGGTNFFKDLMSASQTSVTLRFCFKLNDFFLFLYPKILLISEASKKKKSRSSVLNVVAVQKSKIFSATTVVVVELLLKLLLTTSFRILKSGLSPYAAWCYEKVHRH